MQRKRLLVTPARRLFYLNQAKQSFEWVSAFVAGGSSELDIKGPKRKGKAREDYRLRGQRAAGGEGP
jgi:hypothetical protein